MNIDDKEFILSILEDYAEKAIGLDMDDRLPGINRAISILQRHFFKEADERIIDPRQQELDFSDWHQTQEDEE